MQEVELTCHLTPTVSTRLQECLAGQQPRSVVQQSDHYYDTPDASFFQQAVFVRIRTIDGASRLQFKFDEPESEQIHIACIERDFPFHAEAVVPEPIHTLFRRFLPAWHPRPAWDQICAANTLQAFLTIENTRTIYQLGDYTICLDCIKDLGTFVEVEILCDEQRETHTLQQQVREFLASIGGEPLTAGYVELALRQQQPALYQLGRYHL